MKNSKRFSLLNINNSLFWRTRALLLRKPKHYHINALYLLAHSALESNWGEEVKLPKIRIISLALHYEIRPLTFAKTFMMMDKGILGATKWIKENYIDRGRTFLGNKASGMNVEYASDPYIGAKIAKV